MTQPEPERGVLPRRRRQPSRRPLLLFLAVIVVLGTLGTLYSLVRPRLAFTNRLAGPVRLTVDDHAPRLVAPGGSVRVAAPWRKTIVATWELVRPLSADGRPMGAEVRGTLLGRGRWGTIRDSAVARGPTGDYFAPLITNATDDVLRVTVNAGLEGALDCGCGVRAGARRAFIGYYRLYQNSTVLAKAGGGRSAAFRDLGSQATASQGSLGLRFESKDLRAP